jgi:hypothetical protein
VTAPDVNRADMPEVTDERALLDGWLDHYRTTLSHKCAGLTAERLVERSCPPSPMSLAFLVRHMTEMERAYAHRFVEPQVGLLYCTETSPDGDLDDASVQTALADLTTFTEHCARSRELLAGRSLDDTGYASHRYTLRWAYLYLVKEYARHLGHADLIRERIDGATGE